MAAQLDNLHEGPEPGPGAGRCIALVTNTAWNMIRFRRALLERLVAAGWRTAAIADFSEQELAQVRAWGVDARPLRIEASGTNPMRDVAYCRSLVRLYRELAPDVVHHFSIKPVVYGSLAARLAGVPGVVCSITGLGSGFSSRRRWLALLVHALYRQALAGRTQVVFQNRDDMKRLLENTWVSAERATLVPGSGVDTQLLRPATNVAVAERDTFMMVSRMLWSKGVGDFVEAARLVAASHPRARFVLYGGSREDYGSKNPDFVPRAWLEDLGREGVVEWRGFSPPEEVEAAMQRCAAVVHPSCYPEGVPRSLIEAAAVGAPIITTDTPGCRDIVIDGVSGALCPTKSPPHLAAAMRSLLDDPSRITRLGAAGRRLAVEQFDERRVLDALLRIYHTHGATP